MDKNSFFSNISEEIRFFLPRFPENRTWNRVYTQISVKKSQFSWSVLKKKKVKITEKSKFSHKFKKISENS